MPKGIPIYGDELRTIREQLFATQSEMARKIGLSLGGIQRIEGLFIAFVSLKTLRSLADVAKASPEGLLDRIRVPEDALKKMADALPKDDAEDEVVDTVDQNVDAASEKGFFEIPTFNLSISAGGWAEAIDVGETHDPRSIDQGLFRIRLSGDSMAPKFPDGCIVEFSCIRPSAPEIQIGKCYYVHREDNMATFKCLKSMGKLNLTFVAINKEKYPDAMTVKREDVVRIAVAVAIVNLI